MSWQSLIILQTVLVAFGMLSLRAVARVPAMAKASFAINATWYVVLYVISLTLLPWLGHVDSHVLNHYLWRFVGGGLAFAATNIMTYKTLVYFDAALATIVGTINTLFTIIGATIVLNEDLTSLQVLGAAVLLASIIYGVLATRLPQQKRSKLNQRATLLGSLYALGAGLFFAIAIINEKSLLGSMSAASYAVFGWGGQMLMSVLVAVIVQPKAFRLLRNLRITGWISLTGIFRGIGGACFVLAEVHSNNVALVSVISNFRIIIVVLLGWWLLKERQRIAQKLVASTGAILALTLMFWQK
ncbi:MAG: EamA family transporter [Candidatus Saccharimonadales bacterium]